MMSEEDAVQGETLKALAERAGFKLSDADVEKLAPGLQRTRQMAEDIRKVITPELEPAPIFTAGEEEK